MFFRRQLNVYLMIHLSGREAIIMKEMSNYLQFPSFLVIMWKLLNIRNTCALLYPLQSLERKRWHSWRWLSCSCCASWMFTHGWGLQTCCRKLQGSWLGSFWRMILGFVRCWDCRSIVTGLKFLVLFPTWSIWNLLLVFFLPPLILTYCHGCEPGWLWK